ncbi:unnamed protein product [Rotaria sordida]|uniref:Protein kinase domain-containing protein n=1 Tax=Rotaria sordida TaxID=392033 RepID=A0A813S2P1_9BILA|nr:unnamed protein product [Rotaria sordida]CAF3534485.1 unnamed protein product [Rotaria sordida]CAF3586457.1 unnamed protein product [Rotaria sordida]
MGGVSNHVYFTNGRDHLVDEVVYIHTKPCTFQQNLGAGGFDAVYMVKRSDSVDVTVKVIDKSGVPYMTEALVMSYLTEVSHLEKLR